MKKRYLAIFLCVLAIVMSFQITLPYYVTVPGTIEKLEPLVDVAGGEKGSGSFSLVTVRMGSASLFDLLKAGLSKYEHIYKNEDVLVENETDEEFTVRQMEYMNEAKLGAIITAYTKADKPIQIHYDGLYVLRTLKGMPAEKVIKPGDRIVAIDGQELVREDQYKAIFSKKKTGDSVEVEVVRKNQHKTFQMKMAKLENGNMGIGIVIVESKRVEADPKVEIDSEEIGGPSAGLMFTLEIYDQLTEGDLTKGYQIAGTGTIDEEGNVGAIGGIDQKVVTADKEGVAIFFAPVEAGNAKRAKATAKDIGSKMKIVPVENFDAALAYLEKLPTKQ